MLHWRVSPGTHGRIKGERISAVEEGEGKSGQIRDLRSTEGWVMEREGSLSRSEKKEGKVGKTKEDENTGKG